MLSLGAVTREQQPAELCTTSLEVVDPRGLDTTTSRLHMREPGQSLLSKCGDGKLESSVPLCGDQRNFQMSLNCLS